MRKLKVTEMNRLTVDEFKDAEKLPLTVVLDDVRSMYNVGSVLRSCDAFRVEAVVLCGITATPPHPEIHKTALGAEDSVAWRHAGSALDAVRELQSRGVTVMAVEQCEGSTMLDTFRPDPARSYAVVLGNEVKGVSQAVVDAWKYRNTARSIRSTCRSRQASSCGTSPQAAWPRPSDAAARPVLA